MPDEIEHLLCRYQPAGPPPDLRRRILHAPAAAAAWPWAAAAAALILATALLRAGTGAALHDSYEPAADSSVRAIQDLTAALEGTSDARAIAEAVIYQERVRASNEPAPEADGR